MKNIGDGLNYPKNFRPIYYHSCMNCDYYQGYFDRAITTCKRCRQAGIPPEKMINVKLSSAMFFVCDGWKRIK